MKIFLLPIQSDDCFQNYQKYMQLISKERCSKIEKLHFPKDKQLSLFAELLIRYAIICKLKIPNEKIQFCYGKYGKPELLTEQKYHFSVSHTKGCIAFLEHSVPVGVDIEQIQNAFPEIAEKYFSEKELYYFYHSRTPEKEFYKIWTSKESYLKMTGYGLSLPLQSFCTVSGVAGFQFQHFFWKNYAVTACIPENIEACQLCVLNQQDLLDFFDCLY